MKNNAALLSRSNSSKKVEEPSISVFLPFEPKMTSRKTLESRLQKMSLAVEEGLLAKYPEDIALPMSLKFKKALKNVEYGTYKQSIAIFVSPSVEKIYYLDLPLDEKLIIDGSFEIRDLVYSKKDIHKYLVLVLSSNRSRVFLGNTTVFMRIAFNTTSGVEDFENDIASRVGNFSDPSTRKEVVLDKFLHHIDTSLGFILKAYPLPLFIMGTPRIVGHFQSLTHFHNLVIGFVHGNYDDANDEQIREAIQPLVNDWKHVKQTDLLHRLDLAMGAGKVVTGIHDVYSEASHQRGKLLLVEKNFRVPEPAEGSFETNHIKDRVDEVIEKVIESGGDVEFVDEGILEQYGSIAMTMYY